MSRLCSELIVESLLWLRVSDVITCRMVCRKWRLATERDCVCKKVIENEGSGCVGGVISDRLVARMRHQLRDLDKVSASVNLIFWHLAKRYRASKLAANSRRIVEDGWHHNSILPSFLTATGVPDAAAATIPVFEHKLSVILRSMSELLELAKAST
eukprot:TRINITY_DN16200_c0_g1_i1.p1 TRINITY_DN16200_c0_g1~~TRINITY_DN16200_c0_g1_i1.p1  ORF type:complete len:164 (+),score=15.45 TRINITY_DN16200_c0_g1_i1:25-492(+)